MSHVETRTGAEVESKLLQAAGSAVLDFYQASCPPCRMLEPRLERLALEYSGRIPVYRVDVDRDLNVARRFGVTSLPTVLFTRGGKEVERLDGLITEDALRAAFERAAHA